MPQTYSINAAITVSGMELRSDVLAQVEQVVVDEDLFRPAMFVISLLDPKHDVVETSGLKPGVTVEISAVGQGAEEQGPPLLTGQVVTIECDYDPLGARVVVRGYDALHKLHRRRRTRVFKDATDSDIVKQVAQEAGLEVGLIEPTSEVHEHVSQANVTDWEFLSDRARAAGLDLTIVDGQLQLGRRNTSDAAPPDVGTDSRLLLFGYNLEAFHARMSAADQVGHVEVRGWDQERKEPVAATVAAGTVAAGLDKAKPAELAGLFGDPTFVEVTAPVRSEREAESVAKALAERIGSAFAEAEGTARGSTALRAGTAVRISGVSDQFNGAYVLTRVKHVINRRGYRTQFTISGQHDRSLLGLVASGGAGADASRGDGLEGRRDPGFVRGLVSDINDPKKLGRVKVSFPWLDRDYSSAWAPVMQLGAGPKSGTFFLPAVGDEVLVGFEHGRVDQPVVVGGLFNETDQPPPYGQLLDDGHVVGRTIVSRKGHEIAMHDADDILGIDVMAVDGNAERAVSIGLNGLDRKLVVHSEDKVEVEALGELTVKASKITLQADGELVLKGATIKLN